jgi:hypothetical protein
MMKQRIILTIIAILLLLGGVVVAQPGAVSLPSLSPVEQGVLSGGEYQLVSLPLHQAEGHVWQVSGEASGGKYQLLCPATTMLRGSGCCCTYLPAMLRNY